MENKPNNELERGILRIFFEEVSAISSPDNSISESKMVRQTQNKLKTALRNASERCSCAKRSYDMCEVCQGSDGELVYLRNFFRMIRNAKKHNMTATELQEFIANTHKWVMSAVKK